MSKKARYQVTSQSGPACPRCGKPSQVREHREITEKELRRPFYYLRWFYCRNTRCQTTMFSFAKDIVWNSTPEQQRERRLAERKQGNYRRGMGGSIHQPAANPSALYDGPKLPWED